MPNPLYAQDDDDQPPFVGWNARFSATQRTYVYRILQPQLKESLYGVPFEWDRSWRIKESLHVEKMNEAATHLVGTHDFSSFRGAQCQRASPIVTVKDIGVTCRPFHPLVPSTSVEIPLGLVSILVTGESFVYRQVRNMVGCLVHVGLGKMDPHEVPTLLAARDRSKAPTMAPAHGLFLVDVQHGNFCF